MVRRASVARADEMRDSASFWTQVSSPLYSTAGDIGFEDSSGWKEIAGNPSSVLAATHAHLIVDGRSSPRDELRDPRRPGISFRKASANSRENQEQRRAQKKLI